MLHRMRGWVLPILIGLTCLCAFGVLWLPGLLWGALFFGALSALGVHDLFQTRHAILRSYPVLGHLRFLLEEAGPELRQYLVEHNVEGRPFNRDDRSLMYQRAKDTIDKKPFGTEADVYEPGHGWLIHSMAPKRPIEDPARNFRVGFGGEDCRSPYSASIFNISAMSYGSLSSNAIRALNAGASRGGFAHNTGEGGISRFHQEAGGDLIWQVGTGYFGCRQKNGRFDPVAFEENAALPSVKMIELKLSQGAKPGHGGILPAVKITAEIAAARGISRDEDCVSPPSHMEFDTPRGLISFVVKLRELSKGKPVGIKFSVGDPVDVLAVCRAIVESGVAPDYMAVDGGEGGTGAAPIEMSDHMGMPVKEAIVLVHNALVGIGWRDRIRILASAKLVNSFEMASALALGADSIASARGFMFALGCIQAQHCHLNTCPVGVTTHKPGLERALVVEDKATRVERFHHNTVEALAEIVGAAGLSHPGELGRQHLYQRVSPWEIRPISELYPIARTEDLLRGSETGRLATLWRAASADSFGRTHYVADGNPAPPPHAGF